MRITYCGNWNFRSHVLSLPRYHRWNYRSLVLSLPGAKVTWNFRSLEHSLPNAISKTWSFRSPCFKCVFLSKVTRAASSVYQPTRLMPSHQSHETVPSSNHSRRNQRTPTRVVVDRPNCPPCS